MDGLVFYCDGSFQRGKAGWGIHGYSYIDKRVETALEKNIPTPQGYSNDKAALAQSCTIIELYDAFGCVDGKQTNNTGELQAAIKSLELALKTDAKKLVVLTDSEYVRKGSMQYLQRWKSNGWLKSDGNPPENLDQWKLFDQLNTEWKGNKRQIEFKWVRGHNGNFGNEQADKNANLGANSDKLHNESIRTQKAVKAIKKKPLSNLIMEQHLLFTMDRKVHTPGIYYTYDLGSMKTYGRKPFDSKLEKMLKTDVIIGRPISDAVFSVVKVNEADDYIETMMDLHRDQFKDEYNYLAMLSLPNANKAQVRQSFEDLGEQSLLIHKDSSAISTNDYSLITRTFKPPRKVYEAVAILNTLNTRLDDWLNNKLGKCNTVVDIKDQFYDLKETPKKKELVLKKDITNAIKHLDINVIFAERKFKLRLCLGIDLPTRNQLAKIATGDLRMELILVPVGPVAFEYCTVISNSEGSGIYQSPYIKHIA